MNPTFNSRRYRRASRAWVLHGGSPARMFHYMGQSMSRAIRRVYR